MTAKSFAELVKENFWYLTKQYGFTVKETLFSSDAFGNGKVEFRSSSTIVVVQLARFDVLTSIGPISEQEIGWLSFEQLVEFFSQGKDNMLLDLSMRQQYQFEEWITYRLSQYSIALRKYGEPFLRGDFSGWFKIQKWSLKKMQDEYRAMTGLEFPQNEGYVLYIKQKEKEQG